MHLSFVNRPCIIDGLTVEMCSTVLPLSEAERDRHTSTISTASNSERNHPGAYCCLYRDQSVVHAVPMMNRWTGGPCDDHGRGMQPHARLPKAKLTPGLFWTVWTASDVVIVRPKCPHWMASMT